MLTEQLSSTHAHTMQLFYLRQATQVLKLCRITAVGWMVRAGLTVESFADLRWRCSNTDFEGVVEAFGGEVTLDIGCL